MKGDVIFFEILPDTTLKLLKFEFEGSSNLIKASSQNMVIYFVVNKTMRISVGKPLHILTKDMENLPNGFCKLTNELVLNNNTSIEKIDVFYQNLIYEIQFDIRNNEFKPFL